VSIETDCREIKEKECQPALRRFAKRPGEQSRRKSPIHLYQKENDRAPAQKNSRAAKMRRGRSFQGLGKKDYKSDHGGEPTNKKEKKGRNLGRSKGQKKPKEGPARATRLRNTMQKASPSTFASNFQGDIGVCAAGKWVA